MCYFNLKSKLTFATLCCLIGFLVKLLKKLLIILHFKTFQKIILKNTCEVNIVKNSFFIFIYIHQFRPFFFLLDQTFPLSHKKKSKNFLLLEFLSCFWVFKIRKKYLVPLEMLRVTLFNMLSKAIKNIFSFILGFSNTPKNWTK